MTDTLDRRIVAALGADGRADAVSIAEDLDAVPTTVQKRLRSLEAVTARLQETTNVVTVYDASDRFDVFAVAKFESDEEIGRFLERLHTYPDVRNVQVETVRKVHSEGPPLRGP